MKQSSFSLLQSVLIYVFIVHLKVINGDISDDECGVYETKAIKQPSEPFTDQTFQRRKVVQKSLLIVFDGTGSMSNDLQEMREAAKEIVGTYSGGKDNPIKNYVLTVFQDPRVPVEVNTEDPSKLFAALDAITLGDLGEHAIVFI
jgi:hypothetical protein